MRVSWPGAGSPSSRRTCPVDDFYSDAELLKIEAAGRITAHQMQELRDGVVREWWWKPYVPWDAVSAGQGPNLSTTEGES